MVRITPPIPGSVSVDLKEYQAGYDKKHGYSKSYVRGNTENSVVDEHKHDNQSRAYKSGFYTVFNGVGTERRSYRAVFENFDRDRQSSGAEHNRKSVGFGS